MINTNLSDRPDRFAFLMLKPDSEMLRKGGCILNWIAQRGFVPRLQKRLLLTPELRDRLYSSSRCDSVSDWGLGYQFYEFAPCTAVILERVHGECKHSASRQLSSLKGGAHPHTAAPGTVRFEFGASSTIANLIHTSDDTESTLQEARLFFSEEETKEMPVSITARTTLDCQHRPKRSFDPVPQFFELKTRLYKSVDEPDTSAIIDHLSSCSEKYKEWTVAGREKAESIALDLQVERGLKNCTSFRDPHNCIEILTLKSIPTPKALDRVVKRAAELCYLDEWQLFMLRIWISCFHLGKRDQ